ncbi:MAG TPA: helix-turn-helix transcriptional regulator [Herpetosiphonaceae bacterium]
MNDKKLYLGEFEEIVLLAVLRLGSNAYGVTIRQTVEEVAGRPTSIGAIYTTLERLEQKGFVSSWQGEATPERGGRAKRYFKIEGAARQALNEAELIRARLREGLNGGLQPVGSAI